MPRQRGLSVLVVGDDWQSSEALALPLQAAGYGVEIVRDRAAVREAARVNRFDVVLLDVNPPDVAAVACLFHEGSSWRRPFLIALAEQAVRRGREAEIDLELVKPVVPEVLLSLLRRFQSVLADVEGFDPGI